MVIGEKKVIFVVRLRLITKITFPFEVFTPISKCTLPVGFRSRSLTQTVLCPLRNI